MSCHSPSLRGQATATINGTVLDSSGAVVADATVVLHSEDTHLDRTVVTNILGIYVISQIQPGHYSLKLTKDRVPLRGQNERKP